MKATLNRIKEETALGRHKKRKSAQNDEEIHMIAHVKTEPHEPGELIKSGRIAATKPALTFKELMDRERNKFETNLHLEDYQEGDEVCPCSNNSCLSKCW